MFSKIILSFFCLIAVVAAVLPEFPDDIIVFPERDFINVLGFNGANLNTPHSGKKAQLQVVRSINGVSTIIGEAFPTISGTNFAFDINHPFGYCWGAGSTYQVTPDVQAGDQVIIKINGVEIASSTVLPIKITQKAIVQNVVVLSGTGVSALPDPNFIDCRIVQPALVNTIVGRRDVRAIPAAAGVLRTTGYTSSLVTDGDIFTCTFTFFDSTGQPNPTNAASAYSGISSVSGWLFADAAGNTNGMTISEFEGAGGPMDSTCPIAADKAKPVANEGFGYDGSKLYWNAGENIPGATNKFNYYNVEVFRTAPVTGVVSIGGAKVPSTLTNAAYVAPSINAPLATNDGVHVRSVVDTAAADLASTSQRKSYTATSLAAGTTAQAPTFSASNNAIVSSVTIASSQSLQIAYTVTAGTTGTIPVLGVNALIYSPTKPIAITGTQTVVAFAFDGSGKVSSRTTATFNNPTPGQVQLVTGVLIAPKKIRVSWVPYTASTITEYRIYIVNGNSRTLLGTALPAATSFDAIDTTKLTVGQAYSFVVTAINTFNGATYESVASVPTIPASFYAGPDAITHTIAYKPGVELRMSGIGDVEGSIVSVYLPGSTTPIGAAAVTDGVYRLRIRPVANGITTVDIRTSFGYSSPDVPVI